MISIQSVMTEDHRRCDALFAKAELEVSKNKWQDARVSVTNFIENLLSHLEHEESTLFPAFEETTGMKHGPTEMMRHEHVQIRELLEQMDEAVSSKNQDRYLGLSETLLIFMQQHNMKEEQILYPMIDSECADKAEELTEYIRNINTA